jgi:hypothetical protein
VTGYAVCRITGAVSGHRTREHGDVFVVAWPRLYNSHEIVSLLAGPFDTHAEAADALLRLVGAR